MEKKFQITGMKCQGCVDTVTSRIKAVPSVSKVTVNLDDGIATVEGRDFNSRSILACLKGTPYKIEPVYNESPFPFFRTHSSGDGEKEQ
ncbi:MAG: heavy-metal-associated domain-containing protein [Aeriscardovia sp.]|nr:heavy-metal-associated domain-containing protein [Aeriscardovia sp.]MBO6019215.1 heavy-metal-associated domain-containing protein [Aeriscardovia sp.]MBO6071672.1 heavy-metal-associated domain-containing protein [Aeriscardovia sp.]